VGACEADEELPHLVRFLGENNLIIGSDYGHNDPSKEPQFVANLRTRKDVPAALIEKILCQNARFLWLVRGVRTRPSPAAAGDRTMINGKR
jgi:predicted TIM-barrel fold metal-dependent hydrolase